MEEPKPSFFQPVLDFIKQSERVINVTHKPKQQEFQHIAFSTGLGMIVIGVIGFAISMAAYFLRGS